MHTKPSFKHSRRFYLLTLLLLILVVPLYLSGCGGGGGSGTGSSSSSGNCPQAINPTTSYYVSSTYPANCGSPNYISDPVVLTFSKQPDISYDQYGNPTGTTINAISVTSSSNGVPSPIPVRFEYQSAAPNVLGVKFYAVAGATYNISIANTATANDGTAFSGSNQFQFTIPQTPPLPTPIAPVSGSAYFYGVIPQAHFNNTSQVYNWVYQTGAKIVRIGTNMTADENTQNVFNWTTLDDNLTYAYDNGNGPKALILIVQYQAPSWANGNAPSQAGSGYVACSPTIYANFVKAVIDHIYNDTHPGYPSSEAVAFELGNEPDTPNFWNVYYNNGQSPCAPYYTATPTSDASKYVQYLEAAYTQGKQEAKNDGAPNSLVFLNAGVATDSNDESYFNQIVNAGSYEDAYAIHLYAFADPDSATYPTRSWESFKVLTDDANYAAKKGYGNLHFWITEGGFQTYTLCPDGVDPNTQAYFMTEFFNKLAASTAPYVDAFTYFEMQDNTPSPPAPGIDPCFSSGNGFGLVDDNGNIRPAFNAFEILTK